MRFFRDRMEGNNRRGCGLWVETDWRWEEPESNFFFLRYFIGNGVPGGVCMGLRMMKGWVSLLGLRGRR